MTNEEIAAKFEGHGHEIKSLKHRMDAVEENQKALTELTTSVRELTLEQGHLKDDVGEIKTDVKSILDKPLRRWDGLVDKVLLVLAGAFVAWLAAGASGL